MSANIFAVLSYDFLVQSGYIYYAADIYEIRDTTDIVIR